MLQKSVYTILRTSGKKVGKCKYKTFELTINASKLQLPGQGLIRGSRSEFKVFFTVL